MVRTTFLLSGWSAAPSDLGTSTSPATVHANQPSAPGDRNRNGQRWTVRITDNRHLIFAGTKVTVAPSGAFEVRRLTPNRAGVDHFVAVARNTRTAEVCVARVNR